MLFSGQKNSRQKDFPDGIVINYQRKKVNLGGSAPLARE